MQLPVIGCIIISLFTEFLLASKPLTAYDPAIHTIKLTGGTNYGYYYVNIYVGTPIQRQALIIDTGSQKTIFPCADCDDSNCGHHLNEKYNSTSSSTSHPLKCADKIGSYVCECTEETVDQSNPCRFQQLYAEGSSYEGFLISDQFLFGDELYDIYTDTNKVNKLLDLKLSEIKTQLSFGCAMRETGLFFSQQADGLLGLAPLTNHTRILPNIIDIAFAEHFHTGEQLEFSICLAPTTGLMQIGGYGSIAHFNPDNEITLQFDSSSQYYLISLDGAQVADKVINQKETVFIDSGSTSNYIPKDIYGFIVANFEDHCQSSKNNCLGTRVDVNCFLFDQRTTDIIDFFESFPVIELKFDQNPNFKWKPQDYLIEKRKYKFCFSIHSSYSGVGVLGQSFMRSKDILFDRGNNLIKINDGDCGPYIYGDNHILKSKSKNNPSIDESDSIGIGIIITIILVSLCILIFGRTSKKNEPTIYRCHEYSIRLPDEAIMLAKEVELGQNKFDLKANIEEINQQEHKKGVQDEEQEETDTPNIKEKLDDFKKFQFGTR